MHKALSNSQLECISELESAYKPLSAYVSDSASVFHVVLSSFVSPPVSHGPKSQSNLEQVVYPEPLPRLSVPVPCYTPVAVHRSTPVPAPHCSPVPTPCYTPIAVLCSTPVFLSKCTPVPVLRRTPVSTPPCYPPIAAPCSTPVAMPRRTPAAALLRLLVLVPPCTPVAATRVTPVAAPHGPQVLAPPCTPVASRDFQFRCRYVWVFKSISCLVSVCLSFHALNKAFCLSPFLLLCLILAHMLRAPVLIPPHTHRTSPQQ